MPPRAFSVRRLRAVVRRTSEKITFVNLGLANLSRTGQEVVEVFKHHLGSGKGPLAVANESRLCNNAQPSTKDPGPCPRGEGLQELLHANIRRLTEFHSIVLNLL